MALRFTERTRRFINRCRGRTPDAQRADAKQKRIVMAISENGGISANIVDADLRVGVVSQ